MNVRDRLCLNRVTKPQLPLPEFLEFAASLGMKHAEVRNDFTEKGVLDGLSQAEVEQALARTGVSIATINALYPFDSARHLPQNLARLRGFLADAGQARCPAIILCPLNEAGDPRTAAERERELVGALDAYGPLFEAAGRIGLVEVLGFERSALRTKRAALAAISRCAFPRRYQLVHDTFHHHLSGERDYFPAETGLIHVSGVHAGKARAELDAEDRVLVDAEDVMDNRGQVKALLGGGCQALVSYEPFSSSVRATPLPELRAALLRSVDYLVG
jgi:2-keto-myo-inositol isomerase